MKWTLALAVLALSLSVMADKPARRTFIRRIPKGQFGRAGFQRLAQPVKVVQQPEAVQVVELEPAESAQSPRTSYSGAEARSAPLATSYTGAESRAAPVAISYSAEEAREDIVEAASSEQRPAFIVGTTATAAAPLPAFEQILVDARRPQPVQRQQFLVPNTAAQTTVRAEPIAIVRSTYNAAGTPGYERAFDYSFEAENGISQEAIGEMRLVDDAEVMVMRGSYKYVGNDGLTYEVDWYADETGFHPTARHIPQDVEIPFPEVRAAVAAQIKFAQEEEAARLRASASSASFARSLPDSNADDRLPSYSF